jgi:hypothetical protein
LKKRVVVIRQVFVAQDKTGEIVEKAIFSQEYLKVRPCKRNIRDSVVERHVKRCEKSSLQKIILNKYLITYLLTSWWRILFEKLIVTQLVKQ